MVFSIDGYTSNLITNYVFLCVPLSSFLILLIVYTCVVYCPGKWMEFLATRALGDNKALIILGAPSVSCECCTSPLVNLHMQQLYRALINLLKA